MIRKLSAGFQLLILSALIFQLYSQSYPQNIANLLRKHKINQNAIKIDKLQLEIYDLLDNQMFQNELSGDQCFNPLVDNCIVGLKNYMSNLNIFQKMIQLPGILKDLYQAKGYAEDESKFPPVCDNNFINWVKSQGYTDSNESEFWNCIVSAINQCQPFGSYC